MESEEDYLSLVDREYREVTSIPTVSSACVTHESGDTLTLSVAWSQQDLETKSVKAFSTNHFIEDRNGALSISENVLGFPSIVSDAMFESVSPSKRLKVIFRSCKDPKGDINSKEQTICEIWSKNEAKLAKCINLSALDVHGKIHWDSVFGASQCWSEDESKLLYIAERKKEKSPGYFDRVVPKANGAPESSVKGNQYVFEESWGEQLEQVTNPVICVLDLAEEIVSIIKNVPTHLSPAEAGWGPEGSIFFVGLWNTPYRLGRIYCANRKSAVFLTRINSEGVLEQLSGADDLCVHSVRIAHSKSKIIFLQRRLSGQGDPHRASESLTIYDFLSKTLWPGPALYLFGDKQVSLYADGLPSQCWSSDGVHVAFSSVCDGLSTMVVVDTRTWLVKLMEPCDSVLGWHRNFVFFTKSSLDCVAVELSALQVLANDGDFSYRKASGQALRRDPRFICGTVDDIPGVPRSHFILPQTSVLTGPDAKVPLIVWPHGGPHAVFTGAFIKYVQGFCRAGFACLLVNYRGSTGFCDESLKSLPGNIGFADVEDCQKSAEHFIHKFQDKVDSDMVVVSGGSHGGFLAAHLIGQYPDFYKAAALRNPVINVPVMAGLSDIPDWTYFECGLPFQQPIIPQPEAYIKMLAASPVIHVPNVKAPALLLLGGKDVRVPWSQGKHYYDLLRANGKQAKVLLYPNDQHPLSSVDAEADVFVNICRWFFNHLKGAAKRRLPIA